MNKKKKIDLSNFDFKLEALLQSKNNSFSENIKPSATIDWNIKEMNTQMHI